MQILGHEDERVSTAVVQVRLIHGRIRRKLPHVWTGERNRELSDILIFKIPLLLTFSKQCRQNLPDLKNEQWRAPILSAALSTLAPKRLLGFNRHQRDVLLRQHVTGMNIFHVLQNSNKKKHNTNEKDIFNY